MPLRATIWEFPAGQIDEATEHDEKAIHATGLRELREESGYELAPGGEIQSLGHFFPSAGFTDEHSHLLFAPPGSSRARTDHNSTRTKRSPRLEPSPQKNYAQ